MSAIPARCRSRPRKVYWRPHVNIPGLQGLCSQTLHQPLGGMVLQGQRIRLRQEAPKIRMPQAACAAPITQSCGPVRMPASDTAVLPPTSTLGPQSASGIITRGARVSVQGTARAEQPTTILGGGAAPTGASSFSGRPRFFDFDLCGFLTLPGSVSSHCLPERGTASQNRPPASCIRARHTSLCAFEMDTPLGTTRIPTPARVEGRKGLGGTLMAKILLQLPQKSYGRFSLLKPCRATVRPHPLLLIRRCPRMPVGPWGGRRRPRIA